jgi:hypothetical protein
MRSKLVLGLAVVGALALASARASAADFVATPGAGFQSWTINGQATPPPLNLLRGHTYTFDVQAPGHPLYIKTAASSGSTNQWTEGVTNQGQTQGTITTFTVPADAPATLVYQCSVHPAMLGSLSITSPVVPSGGLLTRGLVGALLGALGYVVLGRLRRALARVGLPA